MRRIVPRESRDLNESCNKILRFAQDDLLSQVRFLLAVEMTDSINTTFYEFIISAHGIFTVEGPVERLVFV